MRFKSRTMKWLLLAFLIWLALLLRLHFELKINVSKSAELIEFKKLNINRSMVKNISKYFDFKMSLGWRNDGNVTQDEMSKYGDMGEPVYLSRLTSEQQRQVDAGWEIHHYNKYVSDLIPVRRNLPDGREQWCKEPGRFLNNLPQTSVIIIFTNEVWSALLRTIHSVLDRSPAHLLKEIILVDDFSNLDYLKKPLDEYMSQYSKVRIVRAEKKEGLTRARLLGMQVATAPVVTFLDSHCECSSGWLEPLLDRIARDPRTVVFPLIDIIRDDTLEYYWMKPDPIFIGGFKWNLEYGWFKLSEERKRNRQHKSEPVTSPTMPGGLFSIDKNFFKYLGTYDPEFEIWGGENLELSFKIWMCGGRIEMALCSRVGHIFKKSLPSRAPNMTDIIYRNVVRVAEVWLDEYSQYFYHRTGTYKGDFGDISSRKQLRQSLDCKSFHWYLTHIYPEQKIPDHPLASGHIKMKDTELCMEHDHEQHINLIECRSEDRKQYWMLSSSGEILYGIFCLENYGYDVEFHKCNGKSTQTWRYIPTKNRIIHENTERCLTAVPASMKVCLKPCDDLDEDEAWVFFNPYPLKN